jgi:integrase
MGSIVTIKGGYRVFIRHKDFNRSETFKTRAAAKQFDAIAEAEYLAGKRTKLSSKTFGEAMQRYAKLVSPKKKGARWEIVRLAALGRDKIASVPLSELGPSDISEWRDRRLLEVSAGSVRREMTLIRSVLEIARKEWQWIEKNPTKDVKPPSDNKPRDRRPTQEEIALLIAHAMLRDTKPETTQARVVLAWLVAIETGMRSGELRSLRPDTVFLDKRFALLETTKNGDRREVPLSTKANDLLKQTEGEFFQGITAQTFEASFRRVRDMAGVKGLTFHDSRHEACSRMAQFLTVIELAKVLGQRDPKTLMIYFNPTVQSLADKLG